MKNKIKASDMYDAVMTANRVDQIFHMLMRNQCKVPEQDTTTLQYIGTRSEG